MACFACPINHSGISIIPWLTKAISSIFASYLCSIGITRAILTLSVTNGVLKFGTRTWKTRAGIFVGGGGGGVGGVALLT